MLLSRQSIASQTITLVCLALILFPQTEHVATAKPLAAADPWVKDLHNPVLSPSPEDGWESAVLTAMVLKEGDTYRLWYSGRSQDGSQDGIGLATSVDGVTWEKSGTNPVMTGRGPGYWDQYALWPYVLIHDGTYRMWYRGESQLNAQSPMVLSIGYATSLDGQTWSRDPSNPVLTAGPEGAWDDYYVASGSVLWEGSTYRMWYTGCTIMRCQIGVATSPDGIHWTRESSIPVLTNGSTGAWDSRDVLGPVVIYSDGLYHLWYSGRSVQAFLVYSIGHATSPDGVTWTKDPDNPVVRPSIGAWDAQGLLVGTVIAEGGGYTLWYDGYDANWVYQIGRARQGPAMPTATPTPTTTPTPTATLEPHTPTATVVTPSSTPTSTETISAASTATMSPNGTATLWATQEATITSAPSATVSGSPKYEVFLPDIRLLD